jgi:hypothetical protein
MASFTGKKMIRTRRAPSDERAAGSENAAARNEMNESNRQPPQSIDRLSVMIQKGSLLAKPRPEQ